MPRPTSTNKHPWGSTGHYKKHPVGSTGQYVPPDNALSPTLIDLVYGPKDITTTYEWMYQNLPNHSVLGMGEGRLMVGIFINAIASLKCGKWAAEAWNWIMDNQADGLHSFNSVCRYLKWDPDYIRKLTVESFKEKAPPITHTTRVYSKLKPSYIAKRD